MLTMESRIEIARPVDQLFAYLSDLSNWPQWLVGIQESRIEGSEKIGVGAKVRQVAKVLGRRFEITGQVVAFDPNKKIAMQVLTGPFPMALTLTFEAIGQASRLTTVLEADPGTYFRLAAPLVKPLLQRQLDADHATLKALVEEGVPALQDRIG
jgi:ribosome-associated toxin RatA of RatAB toxin-antitoxin module